MNAQCQPHRFKSLCLVLARHHRPTTEIANSRRLTWALKIRRERTMHTGILPYNRAAAIQEKAARWGGMLAFHATQDSTTNT
ncbi:hypothetical protein L914_18677 [Phytophthora nicotianae]|uniref:Uncharacterized protein n=1 Tax=Phytophthora nicotianae TaxID=4792 RepID=W2MCW9_PHYNI|nr:hypothetical protein L914_18677 [Phytophthora nicotianae]